MQGQLQSNGEKAGLRGGWVAKEKALLSMAGKQQPLAARAHLPPRVVMALAAWLQALPEDFRFDLVFLWGWQSEPILCRLNIQKKEAWVA